MAERSLVTFAAAGAGAVVVLVVAGVLLVRGCGDGSAGRAAGAATPDKAAQAGNAGMTAKGTDQLRAAGCANAVVVDMARLVSPTMPLRDTEPRYMVTCDVAAGATPPDCGRLAATYFGAVGGKTDAIVSVRVTVQGAPKPTCSRMYAPSGVDLGPFPPVP